MSTPKLATPRPDTATTDRIEKGPRQDPWKLKGELWKYSILDYVARNLSGLGGNTSEDFENSYSIAVGINSLGYANGAEIHTMKTKSFVSGDAQGKNKTQLMDSLKDTNVFLPGAGSLYPAEEKPVGIIDRFFNWAGGGKKQ
jgi:hypothetical protein